MTDRAKTMPLTEKGKSARPWLVLLAVFLASVAAPLNQFKVPPMMPTLIKTFGLDLGTAGLLMSVFAITGFILALPAGVILERLGTKIVGLIAVGCLAAGSALGALAPSAVWLLTSRVIEGIGLGFMIVVAPVVIAATFSPQKRGIPMGIWATWVPLGSLIMYNVAPLLANAFGWQAVWWFGAAFSLVAFIFYWVLVRAQSARDEPAEPSTDDREQSGLFHAIANRNIWLLSLQFCCFNVVVLAFITFLPTFLTSERGYTLETASFVASIIMVASLIASPSGGMISDRIGSRKLVFTVPFIVVTVMFLFPFRLTGWMIPAFLALLGILTGSIPPAVFAAVPEIMKKPKLTGTGMAVLSLGQNLGMFVGPVLFGKLVGATSWVTASYMLVFFSALTVISGLLVKVR